MSVEPLPDHVFREKFIQVTSENFSVIAPAGVGKTSAITDRIANFILQEAQVTTNDNGQNKAKRLAAVTYTEKAAKEIKTRVMNKILILTAESQALQTQAINIFNSIFFGTIHALAAAFLRDYHLCFRLPSDFKIVDDETRLWEEFLRNFGDLLQLIPEHVRNDFLCAHAVDELLPRAKKITDPSILPDGKVDNMPPVNIDNILAYKPKPSETKTMHFLQLFKEWHLLKKDGYYYPFPNINDICTSKVFLAFFFNELKDFLRWQCDLCDFFIKSLAKEYQNFRINSGQLLYDDLITLSIAGLQMDAIIQEIELSPYRIILDEAQDTDWQQFRFLIGIAQSNLRNGIALDIQKNFPSPGYFSMVGDPQQSIYSSRTDIDNYLRLHRALVNSQSATELTFSVTMRCQKKITQFVNDKFPTIFQDVTFVPLIPRHKHDNGRVEIIKLPIRPSDECKIPNDYMVQLFKNKSPDAFGAATWSDIAILAPRKDWLNDIFCIFRSAGNLPTMQRHFDDDNDNRAQPIQWLIACLKYINNPANKREFAGILREIFGLRCQEIIDYFNHGANNVCAKIDEQFSQIRSERHTIPLAKFLLRILSEFKIFQRIHALNIYSNLELSEHFHMLTELCYYAEAERMNYIEAEKFLINKMRANTISEEVIPDALQLMTYHKSKGLEWGSVILPFMYRGRQLKNFSMRDMKTYSDSNTSDFYYKAYNNECRLLYVACTRAKNRLYLIDDSKIFTEKLRTNMISSGNILSLDS